MRAISVKNGRGIADDMFIDNTVPEPVVTGDRILVRIRAFGLNRMDIWQRENEYPYKLPDEAGSIMGVEFSGVVEQKGPECTVETFKIGDRVFGLAYGSAYAEKISVSERMLMPLPSELSFEEAAGIPETFFTSVQAIHLVGNMQPGDNVLIHAGASGVGQSAIQLARLGNANMIFTTAGSDEKCELCRSLGADFAINYKSGEDFADVVARETNGQGVDLIVDLVGADYWQRNVASAAYDSRIVIIAMLSGSKFPGFDMRPLQTRRIWICTTTLRTRRVEYQVQVWDVFVEKVLPALKSRKIRSVIDKVYPWSEGSEAHKRLESNANAGKLICTVD